MKDSPPLTARQDLIVGWIAAGLTRAAMAALLKRSEKTVEYHINGTENHWSIERKVGFSDPARLTHYALAKGLIELYEFDYHHNGEHERLFRGIQPRKE